MSLKGTPYYDMARDAGASDGDEAEQMAQMIMEDERRSYERQLEEKETERREWERRTAEDLEKDE